MKKWFTVEAIDQKTFAISEYKHCEKTHCYLLLGEKRALLIDTGLGVANIGETVKNITSLPILVVTTHAHWDHIGGHKYFKNFAIHEKELNWIQSDFPLSLDAVKTAIGFSRTKFPKEFDLDAYRIFQGTPAKLLKDGDCIYLGERKIEVIYTPGHSPGHVCYYERETEYLFSGGLIYEGCLDLYYPSTNPRKYLKSVNKVRKLPVKKVLPGHFNLNLSVTIIEEIFQALKKLEKNGDLKWGKGVFHFGKFKIHL